MHFITGMDILENMINVVFNVHFLTENVFVFRERDRLRGDNNENKEKKFLDQLNVNLSEHV